MKKKLYLVFALAMIFALLMAPAAFAQEEEDLVPFEVRNKTDQTVFIVLTTGGLPTGPAGEDGGAQALSVPAGLTTSGQRLANIVGAETGPLNFYGVVVGPEETRTFTVRPDVYFSRITACGQTNDGVTDLRRYLRLVFVPCGRDPIKGAPSIEKVGFPDPSDPPMMWYHQWAIPE